MLRISTVFTLRIIGDAISHEFFKSLNAMIGDFVAEAEDKEIYSTPRWSRENFSQYCAWKEYFVVYLDVRRGEEKQVENCKFEFEKIVRKKFILK